MTKACPNKTQMLSKNGCSTAISMLRLRVKASIPPFEAAYGTTFAVVSKA